MKPNSRRDFFKTIAVGVIGNSIFSGLPLSAFAGTGTNSNGIEVQEGFKVLNAETQKSLEALAEAIITGSKQLGIKQLFMDYISKDLGAAGFFDAGLWNLDALSKSKFKKPFYALEEKEDKKEIIEHIRSRNALFFKEFQKTVISLYYSNPEVWKRLSYNGPPQPRGFMDYTSPPKTSGK